MMTGVPKTGFVEETAGGGRTGVALTMVTVVAGEVAALLLESAGVDAVMDSVPAGCGGMVRVATPPMMGAVPRTVAPLEKVTGPVTPGGTCSVMVMEVTVLVLEGLAPGGGRTGEFLLTVWVRGNEVEAL